MSNNLLRYYKKSIIDGFLATVILVLIFIVAYSFNPEVFLLSRSRVAYLEVNINGARRAFEGEVVDGMTILDALNASALAGDISFKYEIDRESNDLKIIALDGYSPATNPKKASFFLNLVRIEAGKIHAMALNSGDKVLIRLE